ncbi:LssY C-terminal domain-containing protein [Vibrio sinaloensis]|uniref:Uncharacterized protein n=1 Tax=Photobacterium sp. (strain ATCC 43367) TaxID=379097 RepID=A0A0A5HTZ3_PHOS4|nr:LssY C-terminal domain-containing protein [Vibrio sinaloensis]KGY07805.1 hypothetical protein NM06_15605 [Vibrio sinaloensis]
MEGVVSLFFGALMDALIGPNLFVPGEPFLLAAGYQLHQGVLSGVFAVMLGGLIGDQASYFIGRRLGKPAQRKLLNWQPKTRRPIARCRHLMATKGNAILVFARLLGPVAWVVPFMAGTQQIGWRRFSFYSSIGLLLGVGQFVFWGYMLAYGVEKFPLLNEAKTFLIEHKLSLYALAATGLFYLVARGFNWRYKVSASFAVLMGSALLANYLHFFLYSDDFLQVEKTAEKSNHIAYVEPSELELKAYPGRSSVFDAQAVNVIYYGENPRKIMLDLGWIENQTFSRNDLELEDYLSLLKQNTPPVSDLFWNGVPQEMAFQLPGNLLKRSHIRWWKGGVDPQSETLFWVGALSYDNGLQLTPYSGIVTVLHSIDPNVDSERDRLEQQVLSTQTSRVARLQTLSEPIEFDEEHDYYSDGRVLMLSE